MEALEDIQKMWSAASGVGLHIAGVGPYINVCKAVYVPSRRLPEAFSNTQSRYDPLETARHAAISDNHPGGAPH
jgi:hypothetical protein